MAAWLKITMPSLAIHFLLTVVPSHSPQSDRRLSPCPPLRASMSQQHMVARKPSGFAASSLRSLATSRAPPPFFQTTRWPLHSHVTTNTTHAQSTLMCIITGSTGLWRRGQSNLSIAPWTTWLLMCSPRPSPPQRWSTLPQPSDCMWSEGECCGFGGWATWAT